MHAGRLDPLGDRVVTGPVIPIGQSGRHRIDAEELANLVAIRSEINTATTELKILVVAGGWRLMDLHGVGPMVAARILADVGGVAVPHWNNVLDRHRRPWMRPPDGGTGPPLRGRDRRMNHVLASAVVTQVRLDSESRAYDVSKPAARKKPTEVMRWREGQISDAAMRLLFADAQPGAGTGPDHSALA